MARAGIAVITYRRPRYLERCLDGIRRHTTGEYDLVVASDDWEDQETRAVCERYSARLVTGPNRGVVWNKNRGLYYLMSRTACEALILIEDDTRPVDDGWQAEWVDAALRWQHVNHTIPALLAPERAPLGGEGTAAHPHVHTLVTGQCTVVTRAAMEVAGYLDSRFRGYGHGHVEWTKRHINLVPAAHEPAYEGRGFTFLSILGGVRSEDAPSFRNQTDIDRNGRLMAQLSAAPGYRAPWSSEEEERLLEAEMTGDPEAIRKYALPGEPPSPPRPPQKTRGAIDRITPLEAGTVSVEGWAAAYDGEPVDRIGIRAGEQRLPGAVRRTVRADVRAAIPEVSDQSGFLIEISRADIDRDTPLVAVDLSTGEDLTPPFQVPKIVQALSVKPGIGQEADTRLAGKSLYFGNLYEHERQFKEPDFIGLALEPKSDRDIRHNVYDRLPAADAAVPKVQAQDVVEHLEYSRIPAIFDEIYRVLSPGGVFRLSVPDYRSPLLKARSVYDENGEVIADLMMGGRVSYDAGSKGRRVEFLTNGDAHLWFPTHEKLMRLVIASKLRLCSQILTRHAFFADGSFVCDAIPDLGMHVMRAPPQDMRSAGKPISLVVDFIK